MELSVVKILTSILLPPTSLIVLALLGMGLSIVWRKLGLWLATVSLTCLLLFSLPVVTTCLVNTLQKDAPILADELEQTLAEAEAVVLLAGGRRTLAEEYGDDTPNSFSLERARYAAWIVRQTGLPLVISGVQVIPAPTVFYGRHSTYSIGEFLPSSYALRFSGLAFHEMFGHLWYKIRYYKV